MVNGIFIVESRTTSYSYEKFYSLSALIGLQPGRDACARNGACADVSRAFIKKKVRMHVIKIFLAAIYDGVRGEQ